MIGGTIGQLKRDETAIRESDRAFVNLFRAAGLDQDVHSVKQLIEVVKQMRLVAEVSKVHEHIVASLEALD